MAHFAKYAASAAGHMTDHYERTPGDGVKRSNVDIDPERTHLNYNLGPQGAGMENLKKRLSEIKVQKRADVNVMCDWVVTLPKYRPTRMVTLDKERVERDFFQQTYNFLADRYGRENVISAYVHMDEKTPHMHFAFVPAVQDKKHPGREKLSAKECVSRADLRSFHADLERHLQRTMPLVAFEVQNGATKEGNKTVTELKRETELQKQSEAAQQTAEARQRAEAALKTARGLESRVEALQGEIKGLQEKKDVLTTEEVRRLKGEKNILGGLKGVTYDQYTALKNTAVRVDKAEERARAAEQRAATVESREKSVMEDYNRQLREKSARLDADYQQKVQELTDRHKQTTLDELNEKMETRRKLERLGKLESFLDAHFPNWRTLFDRFQREQSRTRNKGNELTH